jgi:hypothetical protein
MISLKALRGATAALGITVSLLAMLGWSARAEAIGASSFTCEKTKSLEKATGESNVACGYDALESDTSGSENDAFGMAALFLNSTGGANVAFGTDALFHNTGSENSAFGAEALYENISGGLNVASGVRALFHNTTGKENVASGYTALYYNTTGSSNVASGYKALVYNKEGGGNVATGNAALYENTSGNGNVATGNAALSFNTTGSENVASGPLALWFNTTGKENVASGPSALASNTTGANNVALGDGAGANLTTGSHNVDIANEGVAGESSTTRIGTEGKQTKAYVAGVDKTKVKGCAVQVTGEGELGCNNNPAGSAIATFASTAAVASGKCLYFTGRGAPGTTTCAAATSGYSASKALSLAMPANGATVSNLYAATSASVSGSDTAVVEVIDNSTGALLLSCTVSSTSVNNCSNNASTGTAAAGNKLEVRITTSGSSGASKDWEVTFRY